MSLKEKILLKKKALLISFVILLAVSMICIGTVSSSEYGIPAKTQPKTQVSSVILEDGYYIVTGKAVYFNDNVYKWVPIPKGSVVYLGTDNNGFSVRTTLYLDNDNGDYVGKVAKKDINNNIIAKVADQLIPGDHLSPSESIWDINAIRKKDVPYYLNKKFYWEED